MQAEQDYNQAKPDFLSGSYRLHTAPVSFNFTLEAITFTLIQTYTLKLLTQQPLPNLPVSIASQPLPHKLTATVHSQQRKYIKFAQPIPNESITEEDKQFVELIQGIQSYEWTGGMIRMYGGQNMLWLRGRRPEGKEYPQSDGPYGQWNVEPLNLALEVSDRHFVFEGINNVRYLLTYQATQDGKISFELETQQQIKKTQKKTNLNPAPAKKDFDIMFINALLRSTQFKKGQVSFQLFSDEGKLTARGTPYL